MPTRERMSLIITFCLIVLVAGETYALGSWDELRELYYIGIVFCISLIMCHIPFFIGRQPDPALVRGIDYIWIGMGVVVGIFGVMRLELNSVEKAAQEDIRVATEIINRIEFLAIRVEAQCIPVEAHFRGVTSVLTDDDCRTVHIVLAEIDSMRNQHNDMFPLATTRDGGGYIFNSFGHFVEFARDRRAYEHLATVTKFPLVTDMERLEEITKDGLKNDRWRANIIKRSMFFPPRWWIYFFAVIAALRLSKTTYEIKAGWSAKKKSVPLAPTPP